MSSSVRWSWLVAARASTSERAPRRWALIQEIVRRGGGKIQGKEADGGGAEGLDATFARPVRVREVLDADKKKGVVIRFDDGLRAGGVRALVKTVHEDALKSILRRRRRARRPSPGSGVPEVEKVTLKTTLSQWAPAVGSARTGGERWPEP